MQQLNSRCNRSAFILKGARALQAAPDGTYALADYSNKSKVVDFSYVGYKTVAKTIIPNTEQTVEVALEVLEGNKVTVKTNKRGKYSNKNNPAVDLIKRVIENKDKNKISSYDFVQHEQYEKMEMSLTNKPEKLMNNQLFKNYRFILENQDTTKLEGKALLPFFLEENISQKYYRKTPKKTKKTLC